MTFDEFMTEMTKQMYIWRMARAKDKPGTARTVENAQRAINMAVLARAKALNE